MEPVPAAREDIERLLQAGSWDGLRARLAPDIALARWPGSDPIQTLSREDAVGWLTTRWQQGIAVNSVEEIAHYGILDLHTGPWRRVSPGGPEVVLRTHRYDAGKQSIFGQWRVDVILYE
jgi:hypothetical protein